ncbi:DNRLRE domain-containing protein [Pantoea sp. S62]|nr:DNRLRE domain-containing protein [Pantoea sp. S62]
MVLMLHRCPLPWGRRRGSAGAPLSGEIFLFPLKAHAAGFATGHDLIPGISAPCKLIYLYNCPLTIAEAAKQYLALHDAGNGFSQLRFKYGLCLLELQIHLISV